MLLKRLYKNGKVSGIKVLRAGDKQHFSPNIIDIGTQEGWLRLEGDHVVIKGVDGLVRYKILRTPGEYTVNKKREVIHYYDCVKEKG